MAEGYLVSTYNREPRFTGAVNPVVAGCVISVEAVPEASGVATGGGISRLSPFMGT